MKKILLVIMVCFCSSIAVGAVKMCAENDAVIIPYGTITSNAYSPSSSANGGIWTLTTSYGKMVGISACLNVSGSSHTVNTSIVANGGEQAGAYCWCKMLHPFVSYWMYEGTGSWSTWNGCYGYSSGNSDSVSECNSSCTYRCANHLMCDATMKKNIFTGIQ